MTRRAWWLGSVVLAAGLGLQALWWFSEGVDERRAPPETQRRAPPARTPREDRSKPRPRTPGRAPKDLDPEVARERAASIVPRALGAREAETFSAQVQSLEEIGGEAAARAFYDIARQRPDTRLDVAMRISRIQDRRAAPALEDVIAAENRRGELAAAAVRALGRMRLRHYVPRLCRWAADPQADAKLREAAAYALGQIADPAAVATLAGLLKDRSAALRRRAIGSLGKIVAPESMAALRAFARRTADQHERVLAENALATLRGEPRPFGR